PCFYQNLNDEIPIDYQLIVRRIYQLWIFYSITLVVNLVACLAWWIGGGYGINFGLAMLWLALFSPCSYVCWFRPVYKAFRSDSSFNFMLFFFLMGMQLLLSILQTIGFSGWGACGWMSAVLFYSTNVGAAVIMTFSAMMFTISTVVMLFCLFRVSRFLSRLRLARPFFGAGMMGQLPGACWSSCPSTQLPLVVLFVMVA
uniref:Secretory carrier-associated membrane protein n=1 Tax=Varanus komodoensis TaxID=61221 RepID=A0A8D2LCG4_VARKO